MSGVLYIVATPIGNLDDISLRAIEILRSVDAIAAEDTRHSKRMLEHLGIRSRLLSCHEHNEAARTVELLERLDAGEDIALISDAGTPLISDPGYQLVRAAREAGIAVVPVPGASSIVTALSAAGLPTDRFYYCGFLSSKSKERLAQLEALRQIPGTLVILESTHRIERLLAQLAEVFPHNPCVIAKELTKLHERFMIGSASELLSRLQGDVQLQKGEFVVLIDNGNRHRASGDYSQAEDLLRDLLKHVPVKVAVDIAARATGRKKNDLYRQALQIRSADAEAG
jgi:16S rRNA (cytidine1402-2'-O)-methyltransferase